MSTGNRHIHVFDLGLSDYYATWELQKRIAQLRRENIIPDVLLLNQHNHVYTLGRNSDENHLLADAGELAARGVAVFPVDRGGGITYHGPGQLVGYPILNLEGYYTDVHRYLRDLEETLIITLAEFGISAAREDGYTGVWVGRDKIAAIGIKVSQWITTHGFALNVNPDLSYFNRIIPCGIFHRGVTTMSHVIGREIPVSEVLTVFVTKFCDVFDVKSCFEPYSVHEFIELVTQE